MSALEEWKKQVEDYRKSGMRQNDWCAAQGIPKGTFQYRLKCVQDAESPSRKSALGFFELRNKRSMIKLRCRSIEIDVWPDFDPVTLQQIISLLEQVK